jgi:hypothetical protein
VLKARQLEKKMVIADTLSGKMTEATLFLIKM